MMRDILIWVHSCPQRANKLGPLIESLKLSDVDYYETHVCEEKGVANVERWNRDKLLELSGKAKWVVRLEDDTIVNRNLMSNLRNWPAMNSGSEFGIGLLHLNNIYWEDNDFRSCLLRDKQSGSVWVNQRKVCGAQGQVFNSETFVGKIYPRLPLLPGGEMDIGMTAAAYDAGLRVYLSYPDLVEQSDVAHDSIIGHSHSERFYMSGNFDANYLYDGSSTFDVRAESLLGKHYSALFVNSKKEIVTVAVPLGAHPLPKGLLFGTYHGTPIMMKGKNVFFTMEEALQFAGPNGYVVR
jgi:hypothetical protein